MKLKRIEVWYNAETLRAFPNVMAETIKLDKELCLLTFKMDNVLNEQICINIKNVFFFDIMDNTK